MRRQLRREVAAQYTAFAATGLRLDHANAHKHMHLHPTIGRYLIEEGLPHGLARVRIPAEPPDIMARLGSPPGLGGHALYRFTQGLRRQAHRAGLQTNDHVFGLGWSGHMTADRVIRLAAALPPGLSEIYFHPATVQDATVARLMPDYEPVAELSALLDPVVAEAFRSWGNPSHGAAHPWPGIGLTFVAVHRIVRRAVSLHLRASSVRVYVAGGVAAPKPSYTWKYQQPR